MCTFAYVFHSHRYLPPQIERVQNVRLRQAYAVQRQQLEDKNGPLVGAREKMLYHGTTAQACQSIMKTNFNRSFAGQNGTSALSSLLCVYSVSKASYK